MTVEPISLRDHVDALLDAHHREHGLEATALLAALLALQQAATKTEQSNAEWRASANEWRGALTDQSRTFLGREEYNTAHRALEQQVSAAERETIHRAETNAAAIASLLAQVALVNAQMSDVRSDLLWVTRGLLGVLLAVAAQAIWFAISHGSP